MKKQCYVLYVSESYADDLKPISVYENKEDAIGDGSSIMHDRSWLVDDYIEFCEDCRADHAPVPSFTEFVMILDPPLMDVKAFPLYDQRQHA